MPLLYLTDVEGRWEKLVDFCRDNPWVALDDTGALRLTPEATLVFGGDTIDRGAAGRRVLRALVELADRHPDRVVLLAGNRDINKLRLPRELGGHPRGDAPPGTRADILRWTLARTMGAAEAFAWRAAELGTDDDEAIVESMLADLDEDGLLWRYLAHARLGWRHGRTLFVHGAVTEANLGLLPDGTRVAGVDDWLEGLDRFYRGQLEAFRCAPRGEDHRPLIAYQAPLPGTRSNPTSVVYARPVDPEGNAILPPPALRRRLREQGIRRLVVGHTPAGDTPAVVRAAGFELIAADNSYARLERGSLVVIDGPRTRVRATVQPAGESPQALACDLHLDEPSVIGRRDRNSGRLVKGRLADGRYLLFRFLPQFQPEETAQADLSACRWR